MKNPYPDLGRIALAPASLARRYQTAVDAARNGRVLLPTYVDAFTAAAADYLRAELLAESGSQRETLMSTAPTLALALELGRARNRTMAVAIEAGILARQRAKQTAAQLGLEPETVLWYRRLFFALGSHINDVGWVLEQAIAGEYGRGPLAERHAMEKFVAYFWGPAGLKQINSHFRRPARGELWQPPREVLQRSAWEHNLCLLLSTMLDPHKRTSSPPAADVVDRILDALQGSPLAAIPTSIFSGHKPV